MAWYDPLSLKKRNNVTQNLSDLFLNLTFSFCWFTLLCPKGGNLRRWPSADQALVTLKREYKANIMKISFLPDF